MQMWVDFEEWENPRSQVAIDYNSANIAHIQRFVVEVEGVIDVHYTSLTSHQLKTTITAILWWHESQILRIQFPRIDHVIGQLDNQQLKLHVKLTSQKH